MKLSRRRIRPFQHRDALLAMPTAVAPLVHVWIHAVEVTALLPSPPSAGTAEASSIARRSSTSELGHIARGGVAPFGRSSRPQVHTHARTRVVVVVVVVLVLVVPPLPAAPPGVSCVW